MLIKILRNSALCLHSFFSRFSRKCFINSLFYKIFAAGIAGILLVHIPSEASEEIAVSEPAGVADSVVVKAGEKYYRNPLHHFLWGWHYRKIWEVPVKVPVFDISKEKGGLTPTKTGGSFQTKNLRLEDSLGNEYVLRSVDKDPTKALPEGLRNTFIGKWMRDQTSVIHPYGATIVPPLADAAGVYHTNPKFVVIKDVSALGEFREEFANMLVLFEERPDADQHHISSFGNSSKVVGSENTFTHFYSNSCHVIDREKYLRSRLFDMWIGDWSRREDQWRWATMEQGEEVVYQPIPRDRDHAFFRFNDGLFTRVISWFRPSYQTFKHKIKNVDGLTKSAQPMDDVLLAYFTEEDFVRVAEDLQKRLTDQVIEQAVRNWPDTVYALSGATFSSKLRSRREQLPEVAKKWHRSLAKEVIVVGTDKKEEIVVERLNKRETKVTVVRKSGKCEEGEVLGQRVFRKKDTKKIKLYGLGGSDSFKLIGEDTKGVKVEVYGGEGEDYITDETERKSWCNRTVIYSADDDNRIKEGSSSKVKKIKPLAEEFNAAGFLLRHRLD